MKEFIPRPYQSKGVEIGLKYFNGAFKFPALMVFACAAGKSHIIAEIASKLDGGILCIQPSSELLVQNYEKFTDAGGVASLYSASVNSKEIGDTTFATIMSLKGKGKEFKTAGVKYVLIDEAHLSIPPDKSSVFMKFMKDLGILKALGLTASPFLLKGGLEGSKLSMLNRIRPRFFHKILYVSQISEMVENNWWSPLEYEIHPFNMDMLSLNSTGANYTDESIKLALETQGTNNKIYKRIKQLQSDNAKSILVFMDSVENAKKMSENIPNSAFVHGGTPKKERAKIVEVFKNGDLQVLINYGTFTTGFDYPQLSHVIMGRPSNSFALIYQIFGRVVRIHKSKLKGTIIDFCGNIKRFGKLEDIEILDYPNYGWGVFSKDKLLTGYPLLGPPIYKSDLDKRNLNTSKIIVPNYTFDWGSHKGKKLKDVPRDYLEWTIYKSGWDFKSPKMAIFKTVASKYLEESKMETLNL